MRILFWDQTRALSPTFCYRHHPGSESVRAWDSGNQWTQPLLPYGEEKTANSPAARGLEWEIRETLNSRIQTFFLTFTSGFAVHLKSLCLCSCLPLPNAECRGAPSLGRCAQAKKKDSTLPRGTAGLHFPPGEGRQSKVGPGQKLMQMRWFSKLWVESAGSSASNESQIAIWDWNWEKRMFALARD